MRVKYIYPALSLLLIIHINGASKDTSFYKSSLTNNTFFTLAITVTYNGEGRKYYLDSNKTIPILLLTADSTPKEQEEFNNAISKFPIPGNNSAVSMSGNNLIIEMLAPPSTQQVKITDPQKKHYQVSMDKKGKLTVQ